MKKLTHFDGLRGIAALIVFFAHFRPSFCLHINEQVLDLLGVTGVKSRAVTLNFLSLFYEGALPVFIFWVMSAYVISVKLFDRDKMKSEKYLVEAATKRYFRLAIPVVAASFICYVLIRSNLMFNTRVAEQLGKGYADGWLNQQYHFVPGFFHFVRTSFIEVFMNGNCNYNFVLWTMAPELLGSLMCFALFAMIGGNRKRYVVYFTSIVLLTFAGFRDVTYFFYLTFMAGIMWCDAMNSADENVTGKVLVRKSFASGYFISGLLILSFAVPVYSDTIHTLPQNLRYLFAFPVKALSITLAVHRYRILRKVFSLSPMKFLGRISFSVYLLHIPVIFTVGGALYLFAGIPEEIRMLTIFSSVIITLMASAYLFEKYIDRPAISLANKIGRFFSSPRQMPGTLEMAN